MKFSLPPQPPKELTYDHWNKGKATLTPETGVGKLLKAFEAAYKKIDKTAFLEMSEAVSPKEFEVAYDKFKKAMPDLTDITDALTKLEKLASEKAKEGAKSKLFPDKSVKLLQTIVSEAKKLDNYLREMPGEAKEKSLQALEGFEKNKKKKLDLVSDAFNAVMKHDSNSKKTEEILNNRLKEVLELLKTDRNEAKKELVEAVGLLNSMDQYVKQSEKDTEVWRTDHTTIDEETKNYISKQSATFMLLRKNIQKRAAQARLSVQKVHDVVGKVK